MTIKTLARSAALGAALIVSACSSSHPPPPSKESLCTGARAACRVVCDGVVERVCATSGGEAGAE